MSELRNGLFIEIDGQRIYSAGPGKVSVTCNIPYVMSITPTVSNSIKRIVDSLIESEIKADKLQAGILITSDNDPHFTGEWVLTLEKIKG